MFKINKNWNSKLISTLCLPNLNGTYIPYFKHLSKAGFLTNNKIIDDIDVTEFSPGFIKTVNAVKFENFYPSKNSGFSYR